jgi:deoxyribodipyrimidine photo-lyase
MSLAIWWIRRDLRLHDNQALQAARQAADQVIPLFILDPHLLQSAYVGEARKAFLFAALHSLDRDLQTRGAKLIVQHGDPLELLHSWVNEQGVTAIFAEEDVSPYAQSRDRRAQAELPLHFTPGVGITEVGAVRKDDGSVYTVYTPYSRRWKSTIRLDATQVTPAPAHISMPATLPPDQRSDLPAAVPGPHFPPSEQAGRQRADAFLHGKDAPIFRYADERNRPDLAGTSQLSPYLRFGMVSPRVMALHAEQAIAAAPTPSARKGAETWLNELIWREFYQAILAAFPQVRTQSFRPGYDNIAWRNDTDHFAAWCAGQTGYPFIDAAMRQLQQIGWMHNRARMVVAAFMVKDLLIDWRWGERWFMQMLLDGDPAANNGGWQWAAGTGTDAAPYFRIFNPITQSEKFDPEGVYIRRFVPELARVPTTFIHVPWKMSPADQARIGCRIGRDYPLPIVDHAEARLQTLAAYKAAL